MSRLLYVGQQTADLLSDSVDENLERYSSLGFDDLEASGDWRIPLSIHGELALLNELNPEKGKEAEVHNSMLVGRALANLTPSLARENRIWIRLSHVEALSFDHARWLSGCHQNNLAKAVRTHFFASTWTGCRDDHAISRLWWNHHIASNICPNESEAVLSLILSRADLRANLVERSRVGTRLQLSRAIVSELRHNDALRSSELPFRKFMKLLNAQGAGQYVEVWSEDKLKAFVSECAADALR